MLNQKNIQKQQGFTLVEVIVVAVIVAILAGVSIPLYLGYINSTRENAAANAAGSAASFAAACENTGKVTNLVVGTGVPPAGGILGLADGTGVLTCSEPSAGGGAGAVTSSLIIPTDIRIYFLAATPNAINGVNIKGGAPSAAFTFKN